MKYLEGFSAFNQQDLAVFEVLKSKIMQFVDMIEFQEGKGY